MFKNRIVTIIIIIATLILAGIAIFTAVKLYQLRQQSVSPNSPQSNPNAAVATAPPGDVNNCSTTFTLTTPAPGACSTNFTVTKTANPTTVDPSGIVTYTVTIKRTSTDSSSLTISTIEDVTPGTLVVGSVTGIAAPNTSTVSPINGTTDMIWNINKTFANNNSGNTLTFSYKIKMPATIGAGTDNTNTVTITQTGTPNTTCIGEATVHINALASASPSGSPTATPSVSPSPTETPSSAPSVTPTPSSVASATPTPSGNIASPTPTPSTFLANASPTETPTLPETGTSIPTILSAGIGIIVILGAIVLVL